MKPLLLLIFCIYFLFSNQAVATSAPRPGELTGGVEYGFLSSLSQASSDYKYSDALRIGLFGERGIPFGVSLDIGFLNQVKQRYTRIGLFNFGKQPTFSSAATFGVYYRGELLSFNWKEAGNFDYSPGVEVGVTYSFSPNYGIAFCSKATLESDKNVDDKRWGQEDGPQGVFWLGLSLLQMNYYKPAVTSE